MPQVCDNITVYEEMVYEVYEVCEGALTLGSVTVNVFNVKIQAYRTLLQLYAP